MILFIISVVIMLGGIVALVLNEVNYWHNDGCIFGGIFASVLGLIAVASIGASSIAINGITHSSEVRAHLTEQVEGLNRTYEILTTAETDSYTYTAIQQYNAAVAEYKAEVGSNQEKRKNPWINWLTCYVYEEFDVDAVRYF